MNEETPSDLFLEGVARGTERVLLSDAFVEKLADRIADKIAGRFELLDPTEAANLLRVTARTLSDNHVEWGIDKSLAFGPSNPRYLLSQILERARAKVLQGKRRAGAGGIAALPREERKVA